MHQKLFCRRRALRLLLDIGYRRLYQLVTALFDAFDGGVNFDVGGKANALGLAHLGGVDTETSKAKVIAVWKWQLCHISIYTC